MKELVYQISYYAEKCGFNIGVRFVFQFFAEISKTGEIKMSNRKGGGSYVEIQVF